MIDEVFSCFCLFLTLGWDLWKPHGGNLKFYNVHTNWCDWFSKVQRDRKKKKRKKWCKWEKKKREKKCKLSFPIVNESPKNSVLFHQTRVRNFKACTKCQQSLLLVIQWSQGQSAWSVKLSSPWCSCWWPKHCALFFHQTKWGTLWHTLKLVSCQQSPPPPCRSLIIRTVPSAW